MRRSDTDHAWINWKGIWFKIYGDPSTDEVRYLMTKSANALQDLKDQNVYGLDLIERTVPPFYKVISNFGKDEIHIFPEVVKEKRRVVHRIPYKEEYEKIRVDIIPAFEVYGYKDGEWTQLGYVTCSSMSWKPPYTYWRTDNVIGPDLTAAQVAAARAVNPGITVDPFMWCQYKAKHYDQPPGIQAALKPYSGVLQNKEVLIEYEGDTEITIMDISSKFEQIVDRPYHWSGGTWQMNLPTQVNTEGSTILDVPWLTHSYYIACLVSGKTPATGNISYHRPYSAYKHKDWTFGTYLTINNIKVDSTDLGAWKDNYTFPLLQQMGQCSWSSWYVPAPPLPFGPYINDLKCKVSVWDAWQRAGCVGACDLTGCNMPGENCADICDCNALIFSTPLIYTGCPGQGDLAADLGTASYYPPSPWARCNKDYSMGGSYVIPDRYASNCKDLNEHIFWCSRQDNIDIRAYRTMYYRCVDGTEIGDYQGCPTGSSLVLKAIETIVDKYNLIHIDCIIDSMWLSRVVDMDYTWSYLRQWRDEYWGIAHSRYYKFTEESNMLACLISAWNYDINYHTDDNGNWLPSATFPADASVNRWLFMIYSPANPGKLDMKPGLEYDINGIPRGNANSSDCVGFDAGYQMGTKYLFAIPGFTDPDGGPLLCYGEYRLFEITEREKKVVTEYELESVDEY